MGNSRSNYFKDQFVRKQFANIETGNDNLLGSFNVIRFQGQVPTTSLVKVLDTRIYDEYTDVAEAIRKLKQEHPQMSVILFVTENAQNPELYNVAFEYGDPLKTYISTETLLWNYLEQIVEGLIFLEGQGYHYPNISKQYIIATAKNTVKLLNPYTFSDFMKEILQIYLNPQNQMSNRRAHFMNNILRNIKELGITLATLVSNCNEYQLKTDTAYVNKVINSIGAKFSKSLVLLLQSLILNNGQLTSFKDVKQLILRLKAGISGDLQQQFNATSSAGQQVGQVTPMPKQNMPNMGVYQMMSPNNQPQPQIPKQEQSSAFKNPLSSDDRKAKIFDDKPPANKITSLRGPTDFQVSQPPVYQADLGSLKKISNQQFTEQPVNAIAQPSLIDSNLIPQQVKQIPNSAQLAQSVTQQQGSNQLTQSQIQPVNLAESQLSQSNLQNSLVNQQQTANTEVTNIPRTRSVPTNPLLMGTQNKPPSNFPSQLPNATSQGQPIITPPIKQQPIPNLSNSQLQQSQPPTQFPQPVQQYSPQIQGPQPFTQPPQSLSPGNSQNSSQNSSISPLQSPQKSFNPDERDRVQSQPNASLPSMFNDGQTNRKGSLNAEPIIHGNEKLNFMFVNSPDPMNVNITSYFQRRESLGAGLADVPLPQRHDDFFEEDLNEQIMAEAKGIQNEQESLNGVQQMPPVPQAGDLTKRADGIIDQKQVAQSQSVQPIQQVQPPQQLQQIQPSPIQQLQPQSQPSPIPPQLQPIQPQQPIPAQQPMQPLLQPQPQFQAAQPIQQPQPQPQPPQIQQPQSTPQKMIIKMHIKWMSEEQRHQKIIEYDDNTTEEVPFTEEEKTKFVIKTPKQPVNVPLQQPTIQSQPQQPPQPIQPQLIHPKPNNLTSTPSIPQSFGTQSIPGKLSNIHGYNIPNEISSEPFLQTSQFMNSFALLCLFPERSESSLLLFRSRPLLPNSRFNELAQIVNRREPLNPSMYHQVEAQPQLQNSALFTKKEGSVGDLIHIKKDDYHKPVSMENLPRFDKPSMPTALSSNARVIKRN